MNPAAAYLLSGYTVSTDTDLNNRKYDCAKAMLCLMWCIILVLAVAYIVGAVHGDYTDKCTGIIAGFGAVDLVWSIFALLWFSTTFNRASTEIATRDLLIAFFIPLYAIGLNITAFKCHQVTVDMLYAWTIGWHMVMTGILFLACVISIIRGCMSCRTPVTRVTFRERNSEV
tara:strand:- start:334 stop:849 length:516 start_codon:yes stop_codon:yes gene_type:complete